MTAARSAPLSGPAVVGVDVGGTFTDFHVQPAGGAPVRRFKLLSTPDDPARAVQAGLKRLGLGGLDEDTIPNLLREFGSCPQVVHGTTVATNAVLTRTGARCGLVVTRGFGDLLRLGRQSRSELYRLDVPPRVLPVPDLPVAEADERLGPGGQVLRPLAPGEPERIAAWAREHDLQSVAVCLLYSYVRPEHEQAIAAVLREAGLHVSVSHEVLPRAGEYERAATTLLDAYVTPAVAGYLGRIEVFLAGVPEAPPPSPTPVQSPPPFLVLVSSGACLPAAEAARRGVETVLSGPAGGVLGAMAAAREAGVEGDEFPTGCLSPSGERGQVQPVLRILTLDMGGTSTDVCLVDGEPAVAEAMEIDGFPCAVPAVDLHTVGAGGGSIARLDAGGVLRVGPDSAGADPGPACYGRGDVPTVTDAHVVLGTLRPESFAAGSAGDESGLRLQPERAHEAVGRLARAAGLDPVRCAAGILAVADAGMERALRAVSVARGRDPRDFVLVAFGGAGGLHAGSLARRLGLRRVLLPAGAGVLSAAGMAGADLGTERVQSVQKPLAGIASAAGLDLLEDLRRQASERLPAGGVPSEESVRVRWTAELRYFRQSGVLPVQVPCGEDGRPAWDPAALAQAFHEAHRDRYGYAREDEPVELAMVRVRVSVSRGKILTQRRKECQGRPEGDRFEPKLGEVPGGADRMPGLGPASALRSLPPLRALRDAFRRPLSVYTRAALSPGAVLEGPALLEDDTATALLLPGDRARVTAGGHLLVDVGPGASPWAS